MSDMRKEFEAWYENQYSYNPADDWLDIYCRYSNSTINNRWEAFQFAANRANQQREALERQVAAMREQIEIIRLANCDYKANKTTSVNVVDKLCREIFAATQPTTEQYEKRIKAQALREAAHKAESMSPWKEGIDPRMLSSRDCSQDAMCDDIADALRRMAAELEGE